MFFRIVIFIAVLFNSISLLAARPKTCPGSASIGKFQFLVEAAKSHVALPLDSVNLLITGARLRFVPDASSGWGKKTRVTVVLVPSENATGARVTVLQVKKGAADASWKVPFRTSVVGLVVGPSGLSVKKVSSFVKKNPKLVPQMADYAKQASTIEALVQTLSRYEQSTPGATSLQSALNGFSSQYGVTLPALNPNQSSTEQANALLHAMLPAMSPTQSLTSGRVLLRGTTGLAASVASLFFGSPVGLASGGAVLFESLRNSLFPQTDFRPAFTQAADGNSLTMCGSSSQPPKGARIAYLWVKRIPDTEPPAVALARPARLPLDWKSSVTASTATVAQLKEVTRLRNWQLVSGKTGIAVSVSVREEPTDDVLSLNLQHLNLPPGTYHLSADWDWTPVTVPGTITLVSTPDLGSVALAAESEDRLVVGNGVQWAHLTGGDFEFVNRVELINQSRPDDAPADLEMTLPETKAPMPLESLDVRLNCNSLLPGSYSLRLVQRNGSVHQVPVAIHPPNPEIEHLPLRLNLDESGQEVLLRGRELNRIERITSAEAIWTLAPASAGDATERKVKIALKPGAREGNRIAAKVFVSGLHDPLAVASAIVVIGPLPKILSVKMSPAGKTGVQLLPDEIPAGTAISFLLQVEHAGSDPTLEATCAGNGDASPRFTLTAGTRRGALAFDATGGGSFFLSLDPQSVNPAGCLLAVAVSNSAAGISAAYSLGRIVLLPRIDQFTLGDKRVGPDLYAGRLEGRDLQVIEKSGWNRRRGFKVLGIPTPVPGNPQEQTLEIAMPWPPPHPKAPLYIWLHGESRGRRTSATY